MKPFLYALGFLTRIPVGNLPQSREDRQRAVLWYGPAGLLIGLLIYLVAVAAKLFVLPVEIVALITLAVWILITGALHLDGLADCADAWMGGHDAREMLKIMQDTHCGVGGVASVVLVILLKYQALVLVVQSAMIALLFIPPVARFGLTLVICKVPYVRKNGLGDGLSAGVLTLYWYIGCAVAAIAAALVSVSFLAALLAGLAIGFVAVYGLIARKLGGFTGDVYGAFVEVTECMLMICMLGLYI